MALTAAITASAAAQAAPDPALCGVLQDFAKSVRPGEVKEVTFRTTWGRGFKDSTEAGNELYEKRCHRTDDEPSLRLCAYLMKHGSTEFTDVTVKAALSCLSPETRFAPGLMLQQGAFSFSVGTPARGARIEATFGDDVEVGGKAFRLKAQGY